MLEQHEIDRMVSVRVAPWHYQETGPSGSGLTTVVEDDVTEWPKMRTLSGLDWDPVRETAYRKVVTVDENGPKEEFAPVTGSSWLVRSDNGNVLANTIYDSYAIISNSDMGRVVEAMFEGHELRFVTGGSLKGGHKVWLLMQMGDFLEIKGDQSPIARYIALLNTHGPGGCLKAIQTNTRIVCWNTWHSADASATAQGTDASCFSFEHRSGWEGRMKDLQKDVKAAFARAKKQDEEFISLADELIRLPVTAAQEKRFVDDFIHPVSKEWELQESTRKRNNVQTNRLQLAAILDSLTVEGTGIRGTAYGLWQAGVEYAEHYRKFTSAETYLTRSVLTGDVAKKRAKTYALLAAEGRL